MLIAFLRTRESPGDFLFCFCQKRFFCRNGSSAQERGGLKTLGLKTFSLKKFDKKDIGRISAFRSFVHQKWPGHFGFLFASSILPSHFSAYILLFPHFLLAFSDLLFRFAFSFEIWTIFKMAFTFRIFLVQIDSPNRKFCLTNFKTTSESRHF